MLYDDACTQNLLMRAVIMLMIKNVQSEQIHSESQCLIKCLNLCSKCPPLADTQQRRRLRQSMASSITRCGIDDHASTNRCLSFRPVSRFFSALSAGCFFSADFRLMHLKLLNSNRSRVSNSSRVYTLYYTLGF